MYSILRLIFLAFALVVAGQAQAQTSTASEAQIAWRLLDYVSVDYAVAVDDGKVVNPAEYGEMVEFAGQIRTRIDGLPQTGAKAALVRDALQRRVRSLPWCFRTW